MATIDIKRTHSTPRDEARKMAEEVVQKMQQRFELEWHWEGDRCVFAASQGTAKGTRGSVLVTDSEVHVQVDLPFVLRVFKGLIESRVNEGLAKLR